MLSLVTGSSRPFRKFKQIFFQNESLKFFCKICKVPFSLPAAVKSWIDEIVGQSKSQQSFNPPPTQNFNQPPKQNFNPLPKQNFNPPQTQNFNPPPTQNQFNNQFNQFKKPTYQQNFQSQGSILLSNSRLIISGSVIITILCVSYFLIRKRKNEKFGVSLRKVPIDKRTKRTPLKLKPVKLKPVRLK